MAGDEGSSTTGGSSGENEGTLAPAGSHKARASPEQPCASTKKAGGKLSSANSKGGKEKGGGWGDEDRM